MYPRRSSTFASRSGYILIYNKKRITRRPIQDLSAVKKSGASDFLIHSLLFSSRAFIFLQRAFLWKSYTYIRGERRRCTLTSAFLSVQRLFLSFFLRYFSFSAAGTRDDGRGIRRFIFYARSRDLWLEAMNTLIFARSALKRCCALQAKGFIRRVPFHILFHARFVSMEYTSPWKY